MAHKLNASKDFGFLDAYSRVKALGTFGEDADYLPAHYTLIEETLRGLINGFDGAGGYDTNGNIRALTIAAAIISAVNGNERELIDGLSDATMTALEAVLY